GSRITVSSLSRGAGLGFVVVSVAVVVPTQQLKIFEVGWSAAAPVHDVMGLTRVWRSIATGRLAVAVAHDERFPDCGRDGAARAADVEDFRPSGGDDPAVVAYAGEPFERRGRESPVAAALRTNPGRQFGGCAGQFVEVDHHRNVGPHVSGLSDLTAVEGPTEQVGEGVEATLRRRARVVFRRGRVPS